MASGFKKKTPLQVETLERSYADDKFPNQLEMDKCAKSLGLTYTQVKTWFKERRRKERREMDTINNNTNKINNNINNCNKMNGIKRRFIRVQELYPKDYILRKVFRKDGPSLGCEFDAPLKSLGFKKDNEKRPFCSEIQTNAKRRKFSQVQVLAISNPKTLNSPPEKLKPLKPSIEKKKTLNPPFENPKTLDLTLKSSLEKPKTVNETLKSSLEKPKTVNETLKSSLEKPKTLDEILKVPAMKHGLGKGLMTIWKTTNSENREFPEDLNALLDRNVSFNSSTVTQVSEEKKSRKKPNNKKPVKKQIVTSKKIEKKKNAPPNKRKAPCKKAVEPKKNHSPAECELSGDKFRDLSEGQNGHLTLLDDEELELQELQAGPDPLRCSAHLSDSGTHGCALCKDLLAKFPPQNVMMKKPFSGRPWDSSPELVKKLFKVLRFLYTHSNRINMEAFTIDEFVQSFHHKDSMLMGQVHVALLKLLLSDVEKGGIDDFAPISSKDCRFISFLTFFREQELDVNFMIKSLNPLTWIEILRQVLIAAGFGSKNSFLRTDNFNKNKSEMVKYGLKPRTLKGELFTLLSKKGSSGYTVSELAKSPQIMDLNLPNTNEEIEQLIYSTLSSDITLFEKISQFSYRLRVDPNLKGNNTNSNSNSNSNLEDSGSVENNTSDDDSEINDCSKNEGANGKIVKVREIDESYNGEVWVLGLMEGEYSDLRIDEKLEALIALIDLVGGAGSYLRLEEPKSHLYHGSGGKIKKSTNSTHSSPNNTTNNTNNNTSENSIFQMQTVYLGSDRRYNNYYLFLGPCSRDDPGHRIVFFESSEDGHWEAIDTPQDLQELLSVLDKRGIRESSLFTSLNKRRSFLIKSMEASSSNPTGDDLSNSTSPISDIDNNYNPNSGNSDSAPGKGTILTESTPNTASNFDKWVWDGFYSELNAVKSSKKCYSDTWARCQGCHDLYFREEKHCRVCHVTFELDFELEEKYAVHVRNCRELKGNCRGSKGNFRDGNCRNGNFELLPSYKVHNSQLQALKAAVHAIEGSLPEIALPSSWIKSAHKLWVKRLQRTSSLPELLQVLVDFVGAIKEDWLYKCMTAGENSVEDIYLSFQTMPQTSSGLALWIVKLDSLISPFIQKSNSENCIIQLS